MNGKLDNQVLKLFAALLTAILLTSILLLYVH